MKLDLGDMIYKRFRNHVPTLESSCLDVISENMSLIIDRKLPGRQLEFLARAYTNELYKMLKKKSLRQKCHIIFLLNPYWKEVRLWTLPDHSSLVTEKLQEFGHRVTHINLNFSLASENMLMAIVCCLPNAEVLKMNNTSCTDKVISVIRKMCPSLVHLNVSDCLHVTDKGLKNLCTVEGEFVGFNTLQVLDVNRTRVTKKGLTFCLEKIPSLKCLQHKHMSHILYKMHRDDFQEKADESVFYNLTHFRYLGKGRVKPILEVWSYLCPNITSIDINQVRTDEELILCSKFKHLEKLSLTSRADSSNFPYMSVLTVLTGKNLTELRLTFLNISARLMLLCCPNLRKASLTAVNFDFFAMNGVDPEINKLTKLEILQVHHVDFNAIHSAESVKALVAFSPNLQRLSFRFSRKLKYTFVEGIANAIHQLHEIDVTFSDISTRSLVVLFCCDKIEKITMNYCPYVSVEEESAYQQILVNEQENIRWAKHFIDNLSSSEISSDDDDGF